MFGADFQQRTPTNVQTIQTMTPNSTMDSPQLSVQVNVPQPDHNMMNESEDEILNTASENGIDSDPIQKFLPPPPEEKCSHELQVITSIYSVL